MTETDQTSDVAALTVQLLSAYLANNTVGSDDLADLIRSTRAALTEDAIVAEAPPEPETFTPAVSVRKSLASSEHIISLVDGKPYKTLKRHLASHGLTPESYRSRYNLPANYPMVAPDYAAHRRAVAQKIGLGSRKAPIAADEGEDLALDAVADVTAQETPEAKQPSKRGRASSKAPKSGDAAPRDETAGSDAAAEDVTLPAEDVAAQTETAQAPARKSKPRANKAKTASQDGSAASEAADAGATDDGSAGAQAETPSRRSAKATRGAANAAPNDAADGGSSGDGDAPAEGKTTRRKAAAKPKKSPRMARQSKPESNG
jgi:predicted transcriptional regulator